MANEVTHIPIENLKVHPRNSEFFDDISGDEYEKFKESIQNDGIITPIVVSKDLTILSGHQRFKAAQELNLEDVPIVIRKDIDTEEDKLRVLIAANFQRNKNDERKQRKAIAEYVDLCGYKNGEMGNGRKKEGQVGPPTFTLDEIAAQLGTSKRSLKRALKIERDLSEPMKEYLEDGVISKIAASDIISALSEQEQDELMGELDATKRYTKREIEEKVAKIRKEADVNKKKIAELESDNQILHSHIDGLKDEISSGNKLLDKYRAEAAEYYDVKKKLIDMELSPEGPCNIGSLIYDLDSLDRYLEEMIDKISPQKYRPYLYVIRRDSIFGEKLKNKIRTVKQCLDDLEESLTSINNCAYTMHE